MGKTQYASKFGKLSSGHRKWRCQFSFQSWRRAMSNYCTIELISHASKVMLKTLQAGLQKSVNWELLYVEAEFRKGRGTQDQIANIDWIIEKMRGFQKNICFCFIDYAIAFDCVDHNKLKNSSSNGNARPPYLPSEKPICRSRSSS